MRSLLLLLFVVSVVLAEETDIRALMKEYGHARSELIRKGILEKVTKIAPEQRKAAALHLTVALRNADDEATACEFLAALGAEAVPALIEALKDEKARMAPSALAKVGPLAAPAIPELKAVVQECLKLTRDPTHPATARLDKAQRVQWCLGALSGIGEEAWPTLLEYLKSNDDALRNGVVSVLNARTRIKEPAKSIVPLLIECLEKDANVQVRTAAAHSLESFGKDAKVAVPALTKAAESGDWLGEAARNALRAISGKQFPAPTAKDAALSEEEHKVAKLCHEFVEMQEIYRRTDYDKDNVREYAQRLSGDGGLAMFSPDLAQADGTSAAPRPAHGYLFKVLTAQGKHAAGGERSYLKDGNLTEGFALLAWPQTYTPKTHHCFLIAKEGSLYRADLGEQTGALAAGISTFDPGDRWVKTSAGQALRPMVPSVPARGEPGMR